MEDLRKTVDALQRQVARLAAKDAVSQQIYRYGRGMEWLDADLLNDVFFQDAYIDFGFFRGLWRDFLPVLLDVESKPQSVFHFCGAPQMEIADDHTIYMECYGVAGERREGVTTVFGSRYFHTFKKREDLWKSAKMVVMVDWHLSQPTAALPGVDDLESLNTVKNRSSSNPLFRRMSYADTLV